MSANDEKAIELSKTKILLLILGACAFVAIGCWLATADQATIAEFRRYNDPMFVHGLGFVGIVFFGLAGLVGITKLFDRKPGLVFSSAGILNNAGSGSLIPWREITGFDVYQVQRTKMLVVKLADPEKYIEAGSAWKRKLNRINHQMCGSPVTISSTALKIGFEDLQRTANEYLARYRPR